MHLFGDVRRRIIDDDLARCRCGRYTEARIVEHIFDGAAQEVGGKRQVDETRSGNLDLAAHSREHARVDDLLRDRSRVRTDQLSQRQRTVHLGIGPIRPTYDWIRGEVGRCLCGDLCEHRNQQIGDGLKRIGHRVQSASASHQLGILESPNQDR